MPHLDWLKQVQELWSSTTAQMNAVYLLIHELLQAKGFEADDWTGISDLQTRKKIQNRLSNRAQRQYRVLDILRLRLLSVGLKFEFSLKLTSF